MKRFNMETRKSGSIVPRRADDGDWVMYKDAATALRGLEEDLLVATGRIVDLEAEKELIAWHYGAD